MILVYYLSLLVQQDPVGQDNANLLACLNKQCAGTQVSCQNLSANFGKDCIFMDTKPGRRFLMSNFSATNESASAWMYDTPARQLDFRNTLIKGITVPFKTCKVSVKHGGASVDGSRKLEAIRFDNYIDGCLDGYDSLNIGFNYATGRITSIDLDMTGVPISENQKLTDAMVSNYLNQSGTDYQTVLDVYVWYPLTKNRRTVMNSDGSVNLYKMRLVSAKRNTEVKTTYFRMDGSVYNPYQ